MSERDELRRALEVLFPVEEGFTEAFDDLRRLGLIVPVPADEAFREEWGEDEETMYAPSQAGNAGLPGGRGHHRGEPRR